MPEFHSSARIWKLTAAEARDLATVVSGGRTTQSIRLGFQEHVEYVTRSNAYLQWFKRIPREELRVAVPVTRAGTWVDVTAAFVTPTPLNLGPVLAAPIPVVAPLLEEADWRIAEGPPPRDGEARRQIEGIPPVDGLNAFRVLAERQLRENENQRQQARRPVRMDPFNLGDADVAKSKTVKNLSGETTVNQQFGLFSKDRSPIDLRKKLHLSLPPEKFPYDHCVGLEIEVENVRFDDSKKELHVIVNEGWIQKGDGSLRNGMEFITHLGMTAGDACSYVKALDKAFVAGKGGGRTRNEFSFRCGLHAHIDVSQHTNEDIYRACLLYTVVEPLLFEISGKRNKNKFCVAVSDCVSDVEKLIHYGHARDWTNFSKYLGRGSKYMAMNIRTVHRFGTIEFRHHEGTADPQRIKDWLTILCDIVVGAKKHDTAALEKEIEQLNTISAYSKFLATYFPNSQHLLRGVKAFERVMYPGSTFVKQTFITDTLQETPLQTERD